MYSMALLPEKMPLPHRETLPPQAKSTSFRSRCIMLSIFVLLGLWFTIIPPMALFSVPVPVPFSVREPQGEPQEQCRQVDPLLPSNRSSDRLAKMDEYLASPNYRWLSALHLSGAVKIATESFDDMGPVGEDKRWEVFDSLAKYLKRSFPLLHHNLSLAKINTHGLLFTWHGSDSRLQPVMLCAHQDVVPVDESTWDEWEYPPFSGHYDGKYVWGRGASDDKSSLVAILEAVEELVAADFQPARTVLLSFGFDEEISGREGAGHLAATVMDLYGEDGLSVIVDEGSGLVDEWGTLFAAPGVAEKGYVDVELVVRMSGGHSSIPPAHTSIGVAAEWIAEVEKHPHEPRLYEENPYLGMLRCGDKYSPEFPGSVKRELHRRDRLRGGATCRGGRDELAHEAAKAGDAVRYLFTTSLAVDVIHGGAKANALPERTAVTVNARVNVGEHTALVQAHLAGLAAGVARRHNLTLHGFSGVGGAETPNSITLRAESALEPAPVSPTEIPPPGRGATPFSVLAGTTRALYGDKVVVTGGLMTGNTDTRYYWDLSRHVFRFNPGYDPGQTRMVGLHTVNEKVSMQAHISAVRWYSMFLRNMDEAFLLEADPL